MGPDLDIVDGAREDMAGMDIASRFITSNKSYDALEPRPNGSHGPWSVGLKNVILTILGSVSPNISTPGRDVGGWIALFDSACRYAYQDFGTTSLLQLGVLR